MTILCTTMKCEECGALVMVMFDRAEPIRDCSEHKP